MSESPWRPAATLARLRERARLLASIRGFFRRAGVMEVETPVCSAHGSTDPALESLVTRYTGPGAPRGRALYLHTSPEFAMKRLLAAGSGPIYQICRVFRDGERGRRHNPEFTLLEWYRPGFDSHRLMDEVAALIAAVTATDRPVERYSYREVFERTLGIDPHRAAAEELRSCAAARGIAAARESALDAAGWRDLLLTQCIEPELGREGLTFVYDYPVDQASLARVREGDPPLAERFELYLGGVEIANGFHELAHAGEQRDRFTREQVRRRRQGQAEVPMDGHLLAALEAGLPDCAGVALGIDRLLMWMLDAEHIDQVLAFPLERA